MTSHRGWKETADSIMSDDIKNRGLYVSDVAQMYLSLINPNNVSKKLN